MKITVFEATQFGLISPGTNFMLFKDPRDAYCAFIWLHKDDSFKLKNLRIQAGWTLEFTKYLEVLLEID